jgi:NADH-quinone oxidoreductase subunit A
MSPYAPVLILCVITAAVIGFMVTANNLLGPKAANPVKFQSFECGNPPSGGAWGRFSVRFYMTAILFILFDVEVVFLYPWAVLFRDLGLFGFVEMLTFLLVLGVGLLYAWRKGALEWD